MASGGLTAMGRRLRWPTDGRAFACLDVAATLDYELFVLTTAAASAHPGCLVGFATELSRHPARALVCLSRLNDAEAIDASSDTLVVHAVPAADPVIARRFGDGTDTFTCCAWWSASGGAPVLADGERWLAGTVMGRLDLGHHLGYLLHPFAGATRSRRPQLARRSAPDRGDGAAG